LPIIKQIDRYFNYWKEIKKIVMSTDEQINILAYSMYIPFISAMNKAKKIGNNVKTCLIVPDLPSIYGILPKNPVRRFGYNIYGKSTLKAVEYIDKFVFLTENMDEVINKKKKPFIVIEGVAGTTTYKDEVPTGEKRIILYTGTLKNIYGIKSLIDAFCMIENPNYELWVCGSGETENDLKNLMKVNKRVKYFGFVTKDEVRILQEKAHILVNPRTNDGLYTKYSFPSKTIEYLESGKPVIMHKLSGLPKEYEDYLFLLEDERTETLMKKILEVGAMSNEALFLFGQNAKKWVRETKNADIQASKIVELLLYR
jgi:glycosyltransferase involved in cell wall biosynthesis